jgi:tetrapyrrole methylase family protein / MazG family protein
MNDPSAALANLSTTIQILRSELGCPWDRRQTPLTLKKHVEAECSELLAAIDNNDHGNTLEELGDLLYLLMMITRMHEEHGHFDFAGVIEGINAKLIRRHPHVFAGQPYENDEQLREQWQAIKDQEKREKNV